MIGEETWQDKDEEYWMIDKEVKQVAELWERDRTKLDTFLICPASFAKSQNCIFGSPYGGNTSAVYEGFNAKKLGSTVSSR